MTDPNLVTQQAVRSVKWSALTEVVSRAVSPIVLIVLARLLVPEDFGVIAVAQIAISFSQMFWEGGLARALVQMRETPEKAADVAFWTNAVFGVITYTVLFLAAPWIATFFASPASLSVLRVLGLQVVIASLTSVQDALFVRKLDFRQLFWVKLVTAFAPGLFSIPLALLGYGVWALVAGALAGSVANLIVMWWKSPWRPQLRFEWLLAQKLFSFGGWVVVESFGVWFFLWGDKVLVGKFLGTEVLGTYALAWNLVLVLFGLLLNPFWPVLYPTFSRLQDDVHALRAAFHRANRVVIALALPMGVGLLLIGPELASLLFSDKWHGLGLLLSVIGFMDGLAWLVGLNPELYRAVGRPDVNAKMVFFSILFCLPAYLIAVPFGLTVFILTRLGLALVEIPIHVYLCTRMLGVPRLYLWHQGRSMIAATLVMAVVVAILSWTLSWIGKGLPELINLLFLVTSGALAYGGALWLLDRRFVLQTRDLFLRATVT